MEHDFITFANYELKRKQIELLELRSHVDLWAETLSKLTYKPTRYIPDVIEYYCHYFNAKFTSIHDQSVVIVANNSPIGIWPLMIAQADKTPPAQFMTHGDAVLPPLFTPQYPHRASHRLQHKLIDLMRHYGEAQSFTSPQIADVFLGRFGVSEWYAHTIQIAKKSITNHIQYAHIDQGLDFVESHIRKAYKPLISRAKKTFTTTIVGLENADDFSVYKDLHQHVSGRITRAEATWNAQLELIKKGHGFCVLIRDGDVVVGAAYFSMSVDEVAYFSGAYKKEFSDKPLGHLALYTAIEYAISQKIKWFRIGLLRQNSAQKLSDIDFFKNGFASHIILENQTSI